MARHVDELIAQSVITGLRGTHRGERGQGSVIRRTFPIIGGY